MDKIHTPPLLRAHRYRSRPAVERHRFAPPPPQAELQSVEAIAATDPRAIHRPALTPEQDPDAQRPKPGARMSEITNAEPETRLILGSTPSIPGRSTELRQPTGPQATDLEGLRFRMHVQAPMRRLNS